MVMRWRGASTQKRMFINEMNELFEPCRMNMKLIIPIEVQTILNFALLSQPSEKMT
jgi:hypothetical protein